MASEQLCSATDEQVSAMTHCASGVLTVVAGRQEPGGYWLPTDPPGDTRKGLNGAASGEYRGRDFFSQRLPVSTASLSGAG
jgi:hypothetical protein